MGLIQRKEILAKGVPLEPLFKHMLPLMNGYKATRMIQRMEDLQKENIPILAMMANAF